MGKRGPKKGTKYDRRELNFTMRGTLAFAPYLIGLGLSDEDVAMIQGGGWTASGVALVRRAMDEISAEDQK